jgi:hypothetical protein
MFAERNCCNTNIDICSKAEDELGSHVAPKIKEKITSGVYVDLASLLQNSVVQLAEELPAIVNLNCSS